MLNAKQKKFIPEYLSSGCIRTTCEKLKIHEVTYQKWKENPEFMAELQKQFNELYTASLDKLKTLSGEAIDALKRLLKSNDESIKIRAINTVLDNLYKFTDKKDFNLNVTTVNSNLHANIKDLSDDELEQLAEKLGFKRS